MRRDIDAHNKPVFDELHPRIYAVTAGLLVWFALMAWVLFDRNSYVSLALTFVSVLFLVAIRGSVRAVTDLEEVPDAV